MYVHLTPALFAAWNVHPSLSRIHALLRAVDWQQREEMDCGVLALRAHLARSELEQSSMPLWQLVLGIPITDSSSAPPSGSLLSRRVLLPSSGDFRINQIREQFKPEAFCDLLQAWSSDPTSGNFAYVGPRHWLADAWLFFKQEGEERPLVVLLSSKQRQEAGSQSVTAQDIVDEMRRHLQLCDPRQLCDRQQLCDPQQEMCDPQQGMCDPQQGMCDPQQGMCGPPQQMCDPQQGTYDYIYVYLTDQEVLSTPQEGQIAVVGPQQHEACYGRIAAMLSLAKQLCEYAAL
jgi:hypothetical protein